MKIIKAMIAGGLFGAAFFFIPFIIMRVLFFLLIIGFIFRMVGRGRRWGRRGSFPFGGRNQFALADYVRGMSDEEYSRFKQHFTDDTCDRFQRPAAATENK